MVDLFCSRDLLREIIAIALCPVDKRSSQLIWLFGEETPPFFQESSILDSKARYKSSFKWQVSA